ncbi:lipocalin-like domain-containing protein [Rhizobium sp. Root483D2]|uniref:lipocalin-like domain-containing protein n=1 Tax=Rhizobium sp. Root483D2 TaxID=1736545 RepID=UPI0007149EEB|nr:lipocalin-like domain-containing protein [Rhizobium sp. Root483D2]KQY42483.1 iron ABC transporter permease [Rhizobium sp. Root483D2]
MNDRTWSALIAVILSCWVGATAWAQGFAALGTSADGFAVPQRGTEFQFPDDFGAHPDFRIEWWYITANLKGPDGTEYGIQWTLFRSALKPGEAAGWSSPQVWMGNAALTTPSHHFVSEKLARGGVGQAGVKANPFSAFIDDWTMRSPSGTASGLSSLDLSASGLDFRYDLKLLADGPLVKHGDNGYSIKSNAGQASYYYSQPFYSVTGTLDTPQGHVEVTGKAWLDREWSSQPLSDNQSGWDWFSLHFDDGTKLMTFRVRDDKSGYVTGTWIASDGTPAPLKPGEVILTPTSSQEVAGRQLPLTWTIDVPGKGLSVTASALNPNAWMNTRFPYWEGPVRISGTHKGRGYLEMTGYK